MKLTSDVEFDDIKCPIKPPRIVREFGNIFVLLSVMFLPTSCVAVAVLSRPLPQGYQGPAGLLLVAVACLAGWLWLPFYLARKKTSKWLLQVIHYYLNAGDIPEAVRIASKYSAAISYSDFCLSSWFQSFIKEHKVSDPRQVYEVYISKASRCC
jgi:hypothetical protein